MPTRTFLLSPARCDGKRARILLNERSELPLAVQLRSDRGAPLGDVFSFLSGLYFRGKLAYARAFARPPREVPPVLIITTDRGLVAPEHAIHRADIEAFAGVDLAIADDRYRSPLRRDIAALSRASDPDMPVVLLGSIASGKYVDMLLEVFGDRLVFPLDFVGRGDMSRGGLLLRRVEAGEELGYAPVAGATRRGKRPPRLEPLR
jgi:hypothetical protein